MKQVIIILMLLCCKMSSIHAQIFSSYSRGDSLFSLRQYDAAIAEYKTILKDNNQRFKHVYYYNLACAYSLINQLDSSVEILMRIPELTQNAEFIFDSDLSNLHLHRSWRTLIDMYEQNFISENRLLPNFDIAFALSLMKEEGQSIRRLANRKSSSLKHQDSIIEQWRFIDSVNTSKLVNIIDRIGWPDVSKVGSKGAYNAFIILQHSNIDFQKKYISLLRKAVEANKVSPIHLAYLEDRILQLENKPQIYGTQIDVSNNEPKPYPVIEPENLNKRRKSIGLEPIEEYLKSFKTNDY